MKSKKFQARKEESGALLAWAQESKETTMKQATEIKATAIFRVMGQPCWGVPSDDAKRTQPYKVCWNEDDGLWECECEHGQFAAGRGQSANCKHVRAVMTSVLANKAQAEKPPVARAERGSLNLQVKMVAGIPMR